jgi:hypothetical protein
LPESEDPKKNMEELLTEEHQPLSKAAKLNGPAAKPAPSHKAAKPFAFQAGDAIYRRNDPPLTPVIENLVYPGFLLFAGRPKSGKSWLTLQMAMAVALGSPLSGLLKVPKQGKVLYLALEEHPRRTSTRMNLLAPNVDHAELLERIHFVYREEVPPMLSGGLAQLDASLTDWPADLVVIDTLRAFARLGGKAADIVQRDYMVNDYIRLLAEKYKNALVGVDHTRKGSGDLIDVVIGTTGSTAACDAVCVLTRTPDGSSILEGRGREHDDLAYSVRFGNVKDSYGWRIQGSAEDVQTSAARAEIIELLRHEGPLSPRTIATLLRKNAVTVRRLLSKMSYDDQIVKQGKGYVLKNQWVGLDDKD